MLSETRKQQIEVIQNKAARLMTGCARSTDIESLLLEANLLPMSIQYDIQATIAAEKCRRMPDNDPLFKTSTKATPHVRLKRGTETWQHSSDRVLKTLNCCPERKNRNGGVKRMTRLEREMCAADLRKREKLLLFSSVPPWDTKNAEKVIFHTHLLKPWKKKDCVELRKKATKDTLEALGEFDMEMWTDGSVENKVGAGAAILFGKDILKPLDEAMAPSGYLSSSYRSELAAIQVGVSRLVSSQKQISGKSLLICTDSQSLVAAIGFGPISQRATLESNIWKQLLLLIDERKLSRIVVQFVSSHCGVVRNELADKLAGEALLKLSSKQKDAPIPMMAVKAMVKSGMRKHFQENLNSDRNRYRSSGEQFTNLIASSKLSRAEEVLLAQLRTGECRVMGVLRSRLGIGGVSCRWCNNSIETVYHVYSECTDRNILNLKQRLKVKDMKVLHESPTLGLIFCHEAIFLLGGRNMP